jgi:hypothetical protein
MSAGGGVASLRSDQPLPELTVVYREVTMDLTSKWKQKTVQLLETAPANPGDASRSP